MQGVAMATTVVCMSHRTVPLFILDVFPLLQRVCLDTTHSASVCSNIVAAIIVIIIILALSIVSSPLTSLSASAR